jgi:phage nucleotide-binding protein
MAKFNIVKAGKAQKSTYIKALVYGESGAGKSFLAATAPKPLILLTEINGQASIMHSNPDADILHITSSDMLAEVLKDIDENPNDYKQYQTIVIDSITEMQRLIKDKLTSNGRSPMSLPLWGKLANNMRALIRRIRGMKKNVVCIALLEAHIEEESGQRHLKPAFEGKKTSGEIAQFFNWVGFLYPTMETVNKEQITIRNLMVEGPSRVMCKPTFPLTGTIKNPNIEDIFNQILKPSK